MLTTAAVLLAAVAFALVFDYLKVPAGTILGAMIGAAIVAMLSTEPVPFPDLLQKLALVLIGAGIGIQITLDALREMRSLAAPAVISAVLIVLAGLGIAMLLRWLSMSPPEDLLATSPGALSVIAGVAVDRGNAPGEVALFHLVRVILVIVTLPFLVRLLERASQ